MNNYVVGFNNDGILITEQVQASDPNQAKEIAQPKYPDLPIIFVKWLKPQGVKMDKETQLDINIVIAAMREQVGLLALDKAMLTARIEDLEKQLKEKES